MIDDILRAAARKQTSYEFEDGVSVTLVEMSAKDQFKWGDLVKQYENDIVTLYAHLIKQCCPELAKADIEQISNISPVHLTEMAETILGFSEKKK